MIISIQFRFMELGNSNFRGIFIDQKGDAYGRSVYSSIKLCLFIFLYEQEVFL